MCLDEVESWKQRLARKASRIVRAQSRPPSDPATSWFGRVTLCEPGEKWPQWQGRAMWPLLQIVTRELPFCPEGIADLALIRVYVSPSFHDADTESGEGWVVRASPTLAGLAPITDKPHDSTIKPFHGRWEVVEADYPTYEDLPLETPEELKDSYHDLGFENHDGIKVGGWPTNLQSEIYWAPMNQHPHDPAYVFQIGSEPRAGWQWGDSGVGYFGRGTGVHRDKWAMAWQCY
jgi:hypothetical protein